RVLFRSVRLFALFGVVDAQCLLRHDVSGDADAVGAGSEFGRPVRVGLRIGQSDLLAVIGDLWEVLDQGRSGGGGIEVDGVLIVLLDVALVIGVRLDGVEVRGCSGPGQRQIGRIDGGAVGPFGVVVVG